MKKLLFFTSIIAVCAIHTVNAQEYEYVPFPDSGTIWSEVYYPPMDINGNFPPPIYERFALSGEDTTINSLIYKKLYLFYDTVFNVSNATCLGGIREDSNKRVYFKGDTYLHDFKPENHNQGELVLYDFSLNVGDTLREELGLGIIVKYIDTVIIANKARKRFYIKPYTWVTWIEGIGNIRGLLFTSGDRPWNGVFSDLICFKQDHEVLYFNNLYNDCMPLILSIQPNDKKIVELEIYPNPTSQNINIIFPGNETGLLSVYNEIGQKVFETEITNTKDLELTLPCLNNGLYHTVFKSNNNKIYSSKLIIN